MSLKRKVVTSALSGGKGDERKTNNQHELGLRPELRPEPIGEPWDQILGFKAEVVYVKESGHRELKARFQFKGTKIVLVGLVISSVLMYATLSHDQGMIRHVIEILKHLR